MHTPNLLKPLTLLALLSGMSTGQMDMSQHSQHNSSFPQKEKEVMPFSTAQTRHLFQRTGQGGVQEVIALKPNDTTSITAIRGHLRNEAKKFARGDFSSPSYLHGQTMPGLAVLGSAGKAGKLKVQYRELPIGASLTFSITEARAVNALHAWFAAQVNDHGSAAAWKK